MEKEASCGVPFYKVFEKANGSVAIRESHAVVTGLKESKGVFTGRDQQGSS